MNKNNITEVQIRGVFDEVSKYLPGTKYVVSVLDDKLDTSGYYQKQGYNYAVLFYFPLDEAIWEAYTEEKMAALQSRCFPAAKRLGALLEKLCENAGVPVRIPPIAKDHMTAPYITPLSAKEIGVRGGAGWIGRSDLLITKEYGPKITTVGAVFYADSYTPGNPVKESGCGKNCRRCVEACPFKNIYGNTWHEGVLRDDLVNYHGCSASRYEHSTKSSTDIPGVGRKMACCGCMMACPVGVQNVLNVIAATAQAKAV